MRTPLGSVSWLIIALVGGLACDASDDHVPLVDETGFLVGSLVRYSAESPLTAARATVLIVGLPGAVPTAGGELTVSTPADPTPVPVSRSPDGSFVVAVSAAGGETATLRYLLGNAQQTLDVVLDDPLDTVPRPIIGSSSGGQLNVLVLSDGTLAIELDQLINRTTDVVVLNEDTGTSRRATPQETTVTLPGRSGDRVCVFALDPTADAASPTLCTTAP